MEKLSSEMLDGFTKNKNGISDYLDVTDVDVKRLRDDRAEIQLGDEVAFIATASFRITSDGIAKLEKWATMKDSGLRDLSPGDALFSIDADGELISENSPIEEDSVAQWVANHYDFTFLLNGAHHHAFSPVGWVRAMPDGSSGTKQKIALPWIRKLNTASVKDDYVDVDVRIDENLTQPDLSKQEMEFELGRGGYTAGNTKVTAYLRLKTPDLAKLHGKTVHVPLDDCEDGFRLKITFDEAPAAPPAVASAPARTNPKQSKQP